MPKGMSGFARIPFGILPLLHRLWLREFEWWR